MVKMEPLDTVFDPTPSWNWDIARDAVPTHDTVAGFDHNGYRLTKLEVEYAIINASRAQRHRMENYSLMRKDWMHQVAPYGNVSINHSSLYERKSFGGSARAQLMGWIGTTPAVSRLLTVRSKWGLELSIDYADDEGRSFEILGYSANGYDPHEAEEAKLRMEGFVSSSDWDDIAASMLSKISEWVDLPHADASRWKRDFLGL